jgi:hypothetical protein
VSLKYLLGCLDLNKASRREIGSSRVSQSVCNVK